MFDQAAVNSFGGDMGAKMTLYHHRASLNCQCPEWLLTEAALRSVALAKDYQGTACSNHALLQTFLQYAPYARGEEPGASVI